MATSLLRALVDDAEVEVAAGVLALDDVAAKRRVHRPRAGEGVARERVSHRTVAPPRTKRTIGAASASRTTSPTSWLANARASAQSREASSCASEPVEPARPGRWRCGYRRPRRWRRSAPWARRRRAAHRCRAAASSRQRRACARERDRRRRDCRRTAFPVAASVGRKQQRRRPRRRVRCRRGGAPGRLSRHEPKTQSSAVIARAFIVSSLRR